MLRRADYLDLADTVHAVLQRLTALGSDKLTLQHATLLSILPQIQCSTTQAAIAGAPPAAQAVPAADAAAAEQGAATAAAAAGQPAAEAQAGDAGAAQAGQAAAGAAQPATAAAAAQPDTAAAAAAPATTVAAQLQQLIDSLLLAHLPSAPTIAATPALLDQFTQLPPALVTRWVELDKYEVDSGNTIVVLLAAWYDAQTELPSVMDVLQLRKQLSALVPLAALSPCFHQQTLRNLPWWRRPEPGLGMDTTLAHMLVRLAKPCEALRNWWQETAAGGSVAKRANPCKTHTYTVTAEQLRQLWKDKQLPLPSFYYAGYVLGVNLYLEPESDGGEGEPWLVGLRLLSHWPEAIEDYCDNRPADAIMCCFRLSLPHAGSAFKHTMKYWLPGWGLRPTVKATFKSLRDLVPDQSTTLTLTCEIKGWYEAVSE